MIPSLRSSRVFIYINGILLSIGFLEYYLCILLHKYMIIHYISYFVGVLVIFSMRNY